MKKPNPTATALTQVNEIAKLERKVTIELQRLLRKLEELAIKHQTAFRLHPYEMQEFHKSLTDALVAAHLLGIKRVQSSVLQLSLVDDVLKTLRGVNAAQVASLRAKYDASTMQVIANLTTKVNKTVRDSIFKSISDGLATRAIVANIKKDLAAAGLTPSSKHYVETIVRTNTALAYNSARWQEYQRPEFQDMIWGYQYVTVGDDRVRETHKALDGVKLPKDDPFWQRFFPPNGYNCRCQAIPLFDKVRIKNAPVEIAPDPGFNFNPGSIFAGIAV